MLQADLPCEKTELGTLLKDKARQGELLNHDLRMNIDLEPVPIFVMIHKDSISDALSEVINNSSRELKEQNVADPLISISVKIDKSNVAVLITDNALPIDRSLIIKPFEEGASTYAWFSRGSGFGLAFVKEAFRIHGGSCDLSENVSEGGTRIPGVTFTAKLPIEHT